jgi:hypothetical protein
MSDTVQFTPGQTGSTLLHGALSAAHDAHRDALGGLSLPSPSGLKKRLSATVAAFEAHRVASEQRVAIARTVVGHLQQHALLGSQPLHEAVAAVDDPGPATEQGGEGPPRWCPALTWRGERFQGRALGELAERLRAADQLTDEAVAALSWVAKELLGDGPLDLRGHRFALLGAGAELSPAPYLLSAGARVLWIDRKAPTPHPTTSPGRLVHYPQAGDLLTQTRAVAGALAAEVAEGDVHLGLYAYAPGKGRELLLTSAMNALAEAVQPASVGMLVSPTTPGQVAAAEQRDRQRRRAQAPRWQRALARAGVLPDQPYAVAGDVQIAHSIVPLQGPTYLAAQYVAKMLVSEVWAAERPEVRVSANVAGITHTGSMEHPLFLAGFRGAPSFGVQIFTPEQTRVLATLLWLHDVLGPKEETTADGRAAAVSRRSIHGGVRSAPFELDHTIRVAAVLGMVKQPSLLLRLAGR